MNFSEFAHELISSIYSDDLSSQEYYLKYVAAIRKVPIDYLKKIGAFFVPNNEYIAHYGGVHAYKREYDIYYDGVCAWTHFLVIPIRSLSGTIYGFVGWDMNNSLKKEQGEQDLPTYRTTRKSTFNKNNFFLTDPEVIRNTFDSSTIFIVDGVFDVLSLLSRGLPAISVLGSYPGPIHFYFLHWFEHIYVISDNDEAGYKMYRRIHSAIPRTVRILQSKTKDIDDFLKLYPDVATECLKNLLKNPRRFNFELKVKESSKLGEIT